VCNEQALAGRRLIAQPLAQGSQKLPRFRTGFLRGSNVGLIQADVPFCLPDELSHLGHTMLVLNEPVYAHSSSFYPLFCLTQE
jgi:hypothetical protein